MVDFSIYNSNSFGHLDAVCLFIYLVSLSIPSIEVILLPQPPKC